MMRRIEIAYDDDPDLMMIHIKWSRCVDPDLMTIQLWWWSRLDDNLDQVMIQMWWWSRSSDDPDVMMIQQWWASNHDDANPVMKKNWRIRWLEDSKMKMTRWSSWCREEDQCWKLCRKNTFLVKRECWCNCNFGMYSSMYLMSCNPMFILGCIYYVIESYCHAPMFWSGGSIM